MSKRDFEFRIAIKADPEKVWQALTDPEVIPAWSFMDRAELTAGEAGGVYTFYCGENPDDRAEITELQPQRRLAYRWHSSEPEPTFVEYEIEHREPYTMLTFRNSGFHDGPEWNRWYEANFTGWLDLTMTMKRMLENESEGEA